MLYEISRSRFPSDDTVRSLASERLKSLQCKRVMRRRKCVSLLWLISQQSRARAQVSKQECVDIRVSRKWKFPRINCNSPARRKFYIRRENAYVTNKSPKYIRIYCSLQWNIYHVHSVARHCYLYNND